MDAIIPIIFIFIWLMLLYISWLIQKRQREALLNWAQSYGWSYDYHRDRKIYKQYSFLNRLRQRSRE